MTPLLRWVAAMCLGLAFGTAQAGDALAKNDPAQAVGALKAKLQAQEVGRVEVFWIPPSTVTRYAYRPEDLERVFQFKAVVVDVTESRWAEGLRANLDSLRVKATPDRANLRLGIVFYGRDRDQRIAGLYFDGSGRFGAVGDMPVEFDGDFFQWIFRTVSCCLR